jgi:hypothetical protein
VKKCTPGLVESGGVVVIVRSNMALNKRGKENMCIVSAKQKQNCLDFKNSFKLFASSQMQILFLRFIQILRENNPNFEKKKKV